MASPSDLSQTQDSDEIQEIHCEQCEKHAGTYEVARGFCVDCMEYMCTTCLVYHKRYVPGHIQLSNHTMPQDFCFEKCTSHPNQLIKFYCEMCETFACMDCKTSKHQTCKKIAHLSTIVKGVEHCKELQDLTVSIDQISSELDETKEQIDSNVKYIDTLEADANDAVVKHTDDLIKKYNREQQASIEEFDKRMKEIIENLRRERQEKVELSAKQQQLFENKIRKAENDTKRKVKQTKNLDDTKLQSLLQKCTTLKTELNTLKSDIDQKKKIMQRCEIFMKMKSANKTVAQLQQEMQQLQRNIEIQPYKIEALASESTSEQLEARSKFFLLKNVHKSSQKKSAAFHFEIGLHQYGITSMCLLFEKHVLVVDKNKEALLVFKDIQVNSFDVVKLSSGPEDIENLEKDMVAVTLPNLGLVTILTFSQKSLSVINKEEIAVGRICSGIASCQRNLVISFLTPAKIQVFDRYGNVLITFSTDSNNMPLFTCPRHMSVSPDNTMLYVSDSYRNSVTGMKFDGTVVGIYKDKELIKPANLTVDSNGSVFVCGLGSNNVHQLSHDLAKVAILLDKANGIIEPGSISYCQKENKLLVGVKKDKIKVFKISQ